MQPFPSEQIAAVRARLAERGKTVQDFCQEQRLSYHVVMAILHGRSAASRGEGHRAAVLMGLKRQPKQTKRKPAPVWDGVERRGVDRIAAPATPAGARK